MTNQLDWTLAGSTFTAHWNKVNAAYHLEMPGNVTLVASPDRTMAFGTKPARGTAWRAQASHWDEATRTMSRFGRDEYQILHKTAKDAMIAAERIYLDAVNESKHE